MGERAGENAGGRLPDGHEMSETSHPKKGAPILRRAALFAVIFGLAWAALTCASGGSIDSTELDRVLRDAATDSAAPAPTPVPASPLGIRTRLPAAGEPPTAVFSEDEEAFLDELPADGEEGSAEADASPTPADPSAG
ncbi:MAG: hypothetical protein IT350_15545 [Deltaproteobacteria bacterium]|nr:hypothetical protein [Deltaproteobacteria bacterium]